MIIKAFIKELPKNDSNIYKVRIPFLEDNTSHEMIFDALLCYQPGEYNSYKKGDCVYIIFENDKLDTPVIMGKLYTGKNDKNLTTFKEVNELTVTGKVNLPDNTTIAGYSSTDIFKLIQKSSGESMSGGSLEYDLYATWE